MGDRANVRVVQEKDGNSVYLYTHWNGSKLAGIVHRALSRRQRWDDCGYLTRIIFSEMIVGQAADDSDAVARLKEETGYGIMLTAYGPRIVTVDVPLKRVRFNDKVEEDPIRAAADREIAAERARSGKKLPGWSFEQFIALTPDAVQKKWSRA